MDKNCYIYFIQSGKDGPIKIGHARNVMRRLGELQIANYTDLHLLHFFEGDATLESAFHEVMTEHRVRGEWFNAEPALAMLGVIIEKSTDEISSMLADRLVDADIANEQGRMERSCQYQIDNPPLHILRKNTTPHVKARLCDSVLPERTAEMRKGVAIFTASFSPKEN